MSHRRRRALIVTASLATVALSQRLSHAVDAPTFTWTGATSTDFYNSGNYSGGVAPNSNDLVQGPVIIFGAAGASGTTLNTSSVTYGYTNLLVFNAGAPTYTFGSGGQKFEFFGTDNPTANPNLDIVENNSTNTQVFTNFLSLGATGIFNANAGNLVINAPVRVSNNSSNVALYLGASGSHDVYFNVDPSINAAGSLTGGAWSSAAIAGSSAYGNQRGRFFNTNSSGRVYLGDIGNTYRGNFHLTSNVGGRVVLTNNNSLGDPGGVGDYDSVAIYGGNSDTDPTAGNSILQLDGSHALGGGISVSRGNIYLDGRSGLANANVPHIENVAGNNTFSISGDGDWETGWFGAANAGNAAFGRANNGFNPGNINFQSDSGTITFAGGSLNNTRAGGTAPWTIQLFGAGNGVFKNRITNSGSNPGYSLVKNGTGTWTLANASNDYAGATTVNQGTFKIATGASHNGGVNYTVNGGSLVVDGNLTTSSVLVNPTATVAGTGNLHAQVFVSGASVNPGDGGVGVLTMDALGFDDPGNSGGIKSALNIELGATGVDRVNLSNSDGLQFLGGAGSVLINPTSLGGVVNGTYPLVDYNGTALNTGSFSSFSLTSTSVGGLTLSLVNDTVGTSVDLLVTGGIGLNTQWKLDTDGNWTDATKWNPSVPNGQDHIANFGSVISSPRTVTLNSASPAQTVGVMNFTPTGTDGTFYTIAGTGTVIINSSTGTGTINNASGSNVIGAGSLTLQLASNTNVNVNNGTDTLTIGAKITGTGGLNKVGPGLLVLGASSSFSGGTTLSAGTLQISDNNQLGNTSSSVTFAGGTLLAGTDVTLAAARPIVVGATGGTIDTGTNTMTVAGTTSGTGILTKVGNGTLAFNASDTLSGLVLNGGTLAGSGAVTVNSTGTFDLRSGTVSVPLNGTGGVNISTGTVTYTGNNGYTGNTTINSGVLVAPSDSSLGAPGSKLVFAGGAFQASADFSMANTRNVVLNTTGFPIGGHTLTINGPVSGAGGFEMDDASTLVLTGSNSFTGLSVLSIGVIQVTDSNAMTGPAVILGLVAGVGRLELANNINFSSPIQMNARQLASGENNALLSVSGNNTLSSVMTFGGGGGQYNFGVTAGKLTIASDLIMTQNFSRDFNFRGAGNVDINGSVGSTTALASNGQVQFANYGTGIVTLNGADNYRLGNVIAVGGGTLKFAATFGNAETNQTSRSLFAPFDDDGTTGPLFFLNPTRFHVQNNSTIDFSAATQLGLPSGGALLSRPVSGNGTIVGNVALVGNVPIVGAVASMPSSVTTGILIPGDTPILGDTTSGVIGGWTGGSGKLQFNNNLDLSGTGQPSGVTGGHYSWSIGSLTTSGAGTNYDQVTIGGNATFGGTSSLDLDFSQLAAGSTPVVDPSAVGTNVFWTTGHQWKIVDITGAGTNSTQFATINNFNNDSGPAYFKQTLGTGADAGDVFLNYAVSIKGDVNRDGKVNAIDFNTLATNFGANVQSWSLGDFNGSGTVDSADFTLLAMNFGQTSVAPAPSLGSLVPEPTSLGLLGAAAVLGMRRRRSGK